MGQSGVLLLEYPSCSTCRRAKAWLEERGVDYIDRHIRKENPSKEELAKWYGLSDLPLKRFFNTSGVVYREMQLKDKLADMSEDEQLELLASDGRLVKRPLLVTKDAAFPGFKEAEWEQILGL